jgi:hypothetical protein
MLHSKVKNIVSTLQKILLEVNIYMLKKYLIKFYLLRFYTLFETLYYQKFNE